MTHRASGSLTGAGGTAIFWQSWRADRPASANGAVVLVHGAGEHSDRYGHVAERLCDAGLAVWALDHRGHGRSAGPRAVIDRVAHAVCDLDQLVARAAADGPVFMLGHSMGGMLSLAYAHGHQDRLAGLVLSGTLATVDASPALRAIGHAISAVAPRTGLIAIDPATVSRDPAVVAAYEADTLVHHARLPARTVAEIADTVDGLEDRVAAIALPALVLYGEEDALCDPAGSVMLAKRLGGGDVTVVPLPRRGHEILNEPGADAVLDEIAGWISARI